jgi:hypothetical protein
MDARVKPGHDDFYCLMLRSAERASRSIWHSSFETPRLRGSSEPD